jgi:hypothetical protein
VPVGTVRGESLGAATIIAMTTSAPSREPISGHLGKLIAWLEVVRN